MTRFPRRHSAAPGFGSLFSFLSSDEKKLFMNDIRRTILWVIFGFSMVLLWDQWQVYNGKKPHLLAVDQAARDARRRPRLLRPVRLRAPCRRPAVLPPAPAPATRGAAAVPGGSDRGANGSRRSVVTVTHRRCCSLTFDTRRRLAGAQRILQHDGRRQKDKPFVLLDQSPNRVYVAQTGLIGGDFPTHKTPMTFSGDAR